MSTSRKGNELDVSVSMVSWMFGCCRLRWHKEVNKVFQSMGPNDERVIHISKPKLGFESSWALHSTAAEWILNRKPWQDLVPKEQIYTAKSIYTHGVTANRIYIDTSPCNASKMIFYLDKHNFVLIHATIIQSYMSLILMSGTMPCSVTSECSNWIPQNYIRRHSHTVQGKLFLIHKRHQTPFSSSKLESLIVIGWPMATRVWYYAIFRGPYHALFQLTLCILLF